MYSPAPGDSITLDDGSMIATAKSILSTGRSLLSVVAVRSTDGGFTWKYASVVASIAEVPFVHEGPSENALIHLANRGTRCAPWGSAATGV